MLLDGEANLSGRTVSSAEFMYIMIRFVVGSGGIQIVTSMLFTLRDHIDISNKDLVTAKLWMAEQFEIKHADRAWQAPLVYTVLTFSKFVHSINI